jgi:cbb3-type cytochrome oxidase maturation protein
MESLYLLIPIALVFCAIAIRLLLWAIDSGQYDDLDKEAWKILADDDEQSEDKDKTSQQ